MYLSRLSRGWPCRQLLVTQSRFLTTAMVRRPLKVPTPEQQTIAARQVWEPFGQYAAPIVGAEGEHSQRPFLIRLSVTFVCLAVTIFGLGYGNIRRMRRQHLGHHLGKLYYQFGLRGEAGGLLFEDAMTSSRSIALKGSHSDYEFVEENVKRVDMAVTVLLENDALDHAEQVLKQWLLCLKFVVNLDETDRLRVILSTRFGDLACRRDDVAEAHKYYGEALVNGQKLVAIDPCKENQAVLGTILEKVGRFEMSQRRFAEAKVFFENALLQASLVLEETDRQVVTLLNSLSTVCDMCGLHAEGIAAAKRGLMLAMKTNVLPGDLGALHYNLGTLYMHNGDFALSRESLLTTLELAKTSNATEHIEMVERSLAELEQREKEHAATKKSSSWW